MFQVAKEDSSKVLDRKFTSLSDDEPMSASEPDRSVLKGPGYNGTLRITITSTAVNYSQGMDMSSTPVLSYQ